MVAEVDKYLQVLGVTSRDYLISRLKSTSPQRESTDC
jgi:hypothetical protein